MLITESVPPSSAAAASGNQACALLYYSRYINTSVCVDVKYGWELTVARQAGRQPEAGARSRSFLDLVADLASSNILASILYLLQKELYFTNPHI